MKKNIIILIIAIINLFVLCRLLQVALIKAIALILINIVLVSYCFKRLKLSGEIKYGEEDKHFIFSALTTLNYFCRKDTTVARKMVLAISNYLRYMMFDRKYILDEEVYKAMQAYAYIQGLRFENDLKLNYKCDNCFVDKNSVTFIIQNIIWFLTRKKIHNAYIDVYSIKAKYNILVCIRFNFPKEYDEIINSQLKIKLNDVYTDYEENNENYNTIKYTIKSYRLYNKLMVGQGESN